MRSRLLVAFCGLSLGAITGLAQAQVIEPLAPVPPIPTSPEAPPMPGQPLVVGRTVADRPRPEVDPLGVQVGDFFLFPRIELDEAYNDNIYATNGGTVSDFITSVMPSFDLVSNAPGHLLQLSAGADIGRYASHSSENFDDGFAALQGRLDVTAINSILVGARVDRLHEPRTSPDSPTIGTAKDPVEYTTYTGNIGYEQTKTRIGYEVDGVISRSEYEAPPATGGGFLPQDDRNVTGLEGVVRVYYELQPGFQAYVRGSGNHQDYDHAAGFTAEAPGVFLPARDSTGFRIDAGGRFDLTGVTYAEGYIGYLEQDYAANLFGSITGVDFGANLVWNVTSLDTVKLGITRTVNNANAEVFGISISPGYLATIGSASIDHELFRNLLLNGNVSYETDDWQGISRNDDIFSVGAGAKYLMTRNFYAGASWNYAQRNSSGASGGSLFNYSQNIFMLRLSVQL